MATWIMAFAMVYAACCDSDSSVIWLSASPSAPARLTELPRAPVAGTFFVYAGPPAPIGQTVLERLRQQ